MIHLRNHTASGNQHVQYSTRHTSRLQLLTASGHKNELTLPVVPIAVIQRQFVVMAALSRTGVFGYLVFRLQTLD
jgi:hypothetical protein